MTRQAGGPWCAWTLGLHFLCGVAQVVAASLWSAATAEPPGAVEQAHVITIDPTALVPQSWWQVPGVTPSIWTSDPETSDAYRTTEARQLALRPGAYKFVSFTFDFPFRVRADGTVDFSQVLDECVGGRGTQQLIVTCKRTYPHGGKPEY